MSSSSSTSSCRASSSASNDGAITINASDTITDLGLLIYDNVYGLASGNYQATVTISDGAALSGGAGHLFGLAVDRAGAVYAADLEGRRVLKIDAGGRVSTAASSSVVSSPAVTRYSPRRSGDWPPMGCSFSCC